MFVGENIKRYRLAMGMSQQELADSMGYKTRSTIAKIESGENDVSQRKLQKFAAVLDTTVEALICGYTYPQEREVPVLSDPQRSRTVAVVLAGGRSNRNLQNIPSQFISVQGKPIVVYSLGAYQAHPAVDDIYVVCLKGWEDIVRAYADRYGITKLKGILPAGNSGVASLKNALDHIKTRYAPEDTVIIQEATRPMVGAEMISNLLRACAQQHSATICHRMDEYVQFNVSGQRAEYVDRNAMIALQSPEAHRLSLLSEIFAQAQMRQHPLTESCCTMLMYSLGYEIHFIDSSINNIKITREEDIAAFSAWLRMQQ